MEPECRSETYVKTPYNPTKKSQPLFDFHRPTQAELRGGLALDRLIEDATDGAGLEAELSGISLPPIVRWDLRPNMKSPTEDRGLGLAEGQSYQGDCCRRLSGGICVQT